MLYFDHAATTPVFPEVIELLARGFADDFANPASQHRLGKEMALKINIARAQVLKKLGADSESYDIIFTSSATESNNQVIKTFYNGVSKNILHYLSDHPSVTNCLKENGLHLNDCENIISKINDEVELTILSHVNSQSGQIRDIKKLTKEIKEKNPKTRVLVDSAQGVGKIPLSLKDSNIDYLVIAAHKFGGPRGIAALVFKKDAPLKPLLNGGAHELNVRASTPSTPLILALDKALKTATENQEVKLSKSAEQSYKLRNALKALHKNISFPFEDEETSPYINTMTFKGLPSDVLLRALEKENVFVSSSTACSSKVKMNNKMLIGLGIPEELQRNVLRISLSQSTTDDQIEQFIKIFTSTVNSLAFLIK